MNTLDRLNGAIDYVEKHITGEIDMNHLAAIAYYSLYDFQRMFACIAEMSPAEYIRKRRLTLAGLELRYVTMNSTAILRQWSFYCTAQIFLLNAGNCGLSKQRRVFPIMTER